MTKDTLKEAITQRLRINCGCTPRQAGDGDMLRACAMVLRDMMAGDTPYIFVKHIYACASLVGALLCGLLWHYAGEMLSMLAGAGIVILIRALSAHFRWNLPRAHD